MTLEEMDLIEINEAFAAMPLVASKILVDGNETEAYEGENQRKWKAPLPLGTQLDIWIKY